ncbi:MAG: glycoside hydrolase family 3 protein [Clostridia bacterium]|nr:glycoside hydrolase family 3 protein [Clostridia bacterium]
MNKLLNNSKLLKVLMIVFVSLLALMIACNIVGNIFATTINWFFNTAGDTSSTSGKAGEVYYKSEFTQKDANGETLLDAKGKEVLDTEALSKAADELVMKVGEEGFVLLKNNGILPIAKDSTIGMFGQAIDNPLTSGQGSGATSGNTASYVTSIERGGLKINQASYDYYSKDKAGNRTNVPGMHDSNPFRINEVPWSEVSSSANFNAMIQCDYALVAFTRDGGEGYDLPNGVSTIGYDAAELTGPIICEDAWTIAEGSKTGNNYLELNGAERSVLAGLKALKDQGKIKGIIVVLNAANAIQLDFLSKDVCGVDYGVDACLWVGTTGQSGINAVGPILSGDVNPSGHLVDTYTYDNLQEPSIYNFGHNEYTNFQSDYRAKADQTDKYAWKSERYYNAYVEGIYVGYRYYETRYEDYVLGNTTGYDYDSTVAYSFGHGLTYSEFEYSDFAVKDNGDNTMTATVKVTNVSSVPGREVVQLYAQTPYTDYDKENKVEKASVELVGFAKTAELAANASETVEITFHKEVLAAYDYTTAKTYILDAGDYYLSLGNGAHDALNRILVEKGADTTKMVDAAAPIKGEGLVYKWTEEFDDKTFAKSSTTGYEITNQLSSADYNMLSDATMKVEYITRSDWNKSFDITSIDTMKKVHVDLVMTDAMYNDLIPEQYKAPANDATMPTMGEAKGLKLIMFRGVPLDGSVEVNGQTYTWDDLLDQVSFKEMRELISKAQHTTAAIGSVAKPGTSDQNGPSGFSASFVGGGKGAAYPSPAIRAATWDVDLVNRVGEMIGEDGLHSGCTGLLGPAANLHRNAYCGRNFEYYSEDPRLSSVIGAEECIGIQSKGVVVYEKHFAFNDSETHREGVATWFNEQAGREIYLEAFRDILRLDYGNAHAIMSSFSRVGAIWCGDHDGLMNRIARDEWGFDGFICTDADTCNTTTHCVIYMYAPRAVTTGTDIFDGVNNPSHDRAAQLDAFKDDPYLVQAMRTATKRVLYVMANYCAIMNGLGWETEVSSALPWWQLTLIIALVVSAVLAVASAVLFFLSKKGFFLPKE